jgi:haloalkane dehalogenase
VAAVGIVEGVFRVTNDETMDEKMRDLLLDVRRDPTEDLVLRYNVLIEDYLPGLVVRPLHNEEMDAYRSPYLKLGEARRAMLSMARCLPISSDPGPIDDLAEQLRLWCAQSNIPKLVVGGKPGHLVPPAVLATTAKWRNTSTAAINGAHFLMEDSPARLTNVIADWLEDLAYM